MFPLKGRLIRYEGYLPLNGQPRSWAPSYRLLVFSVLFIGLVIASFVFNVVNVIKASRHPTRPLDDFQNLNNKPFVAGQITLPPADELAIVTTLYTDSYAPAVAALGHSLQKVNTTARLIMLYFPSQISPSSLCLATASGFVPHPVERIAPPNNGKGLNPQFIDQFTKLNLWTLDTIGVKELVYLDADTLVKRNFDELFALPFRFAAAPDIWGDWRGVTFEFNAGVMFLQPDSSVFHHMLDVLPSARFPPGFAEQAYLNQYFAADAVRLPVVYNGNLAAKLRYPALWQAMQNETRVIHYTLTKPFLSAQFKQVPLDTLAERVQEATLEWHGALREEIEMWGRMWEETRTTYARELDQCFRLT